MKVIQIAEQISEIIRGIYPLSKLKESKIESVFISLIVITITLFIYGFTIGVWRSPIQGIYAGIKFPLVVILTSIINGTINGFLGKLYGANLTLIETIKSILVSYVIAGLLLFSLSPVFLFLVLNAPPLTETGTNFAYTPILLFHVSAIAIAGVTANLRLVTVVADATSNKTSARKVILAWLLLNLIVGSQLSWNLRPFIGSPNLPVQFIRLNAFDGNFFEAVGRETAKLFN